VDVGERKVGLSRKRLHEGPEEGEEGGVAAGGGPSKGPTKPWERELRGGTGEADGQLISLSGGG
jgi:hypothetical protein